MPPTTRQITVHYNSQNNYTLTPPNTDADPGDTVIFKAEVEDATICFSPSTTLFGASVNVYTSGTPAASFSIPANSPEVNVRYCPAALGGTCTPNSGPVATVTGSIKIS